MRMKSKLFMTVAAIALELLGDVENGSKEPEIALPAIEPGSAPAENKKN